MEDFYVKRREEGFSKDDIYSMPAGEFIVYIKEWLQKNSF
jgi:hypothetical protein